MQTPVDIVRAAFGSLIKASRAIGRPDNTLNRIRLPKENNGSDGIVPIRVAARLVEHAEENGVALRWDDMRPSRELLDALDARDGKGGGA